MAGPLHDPVIDAEPLFTFDAIRVDGRSADAPRLDDVSLTVPASGVTVVMSSRVTEFLAKGGGLRGNGCVGQLASPGT